MRRWRQSGLWRRCQIGEQGSQPTDLRLGHVCRRARMARPETRTSVVRGREQNHGKLGGGRLGSRRRRRSSGLMSTVWSGAYRAAVMPSSEPSPLMARRGAAVCLWPGTILQAWQRFSAMGSSLSMRAATIMSHRWALSSASSSAPSSGSSCAKRTPCASAHIVLADNQLPIVPTVAPILTPLVWQRAPTPFR